MTGRTLEETLAALRLAKERRDYNAVAFFKPYAKQRQFMELGATKRERLLMAGNQQGKSHTGAAETALHLTGDYPADWKGRVWDRPVMGWACGETSLVTRDVSQAKLCGEPGVEALFGTGMIPRDRFIERPSLARGVTDAYDTCQIRHRSGGISILKFKSYEQGRQKMQGTSLDFIWDDEEPPADIYGEQLARITATNGMVFTTFTPLKGMSTVVLRFLNEPSDDRAVVTMVIDDAEHIPEAERAKIIAGYTAAEREARAYGVPMQGEGRVFPFARETLAEAQPDFLPLHWTKLWGIDFGIGHPFGAVLTAWDRDADIFHVLNTVRFADGFPLQHATAMKAIAANVPVAWPQDGNARESDGEQLASKYKAHGLVMLPTHATWPDGGVSTEAGVLEMQERMSVAKFRVRRDLGDWWEEYGMYHRSKGLLVKIKDDLLSATRVALMAKRYGRAVTPGSFYQKPRRQELATGLDFDLFDV